MAKDKTLVQSVLGLNCPNCRKGDLFTKKGVIVYSEMLEMPEECPNCNFHYEMEPGFWLGSLWTSYPIIVLIEVPFLFLALFADGAMIWVYFGAMILSFLVAWPLMLRLGRSIWIHVNVRKGSR
ncbi:MAG: DUF983 domain-containing protein [Fluviicola sp.]|nr:DUF983 domain-containing protein [Fluviicola sp.]